MSVPGIDGDSRPEVGRLSCEDVYLWRSLFAAEVFVDGTCGAASGSHCEDDGCGTGDGVAAGKYSGTCGGSVF